MWKLLAPGVGLGDFLTPVVEKLCILIIKHLQQMTAYRKFPKKKYRNWIPEPGTTISGFANNNKKKNPDRPTLVFFDM
jgi:hypothetical protein